MDIEPGPIFDMELVKLTWVCSKHSVEPCSILHVEPVVLLGGGVKGVIFKTEETTYQAICL